MGYQKNAFIEAMNMQPEMINLFVDKINDLSDAKFIELSKLFVLKTPSKGIEAIIKFWPLYPADLYFSTYKRTIKRKCYSVGFDLFNGDPIAPFVALQIIEKAAESRGKQIASVKIIDLEARAEVASPNLNQHKLVMFFNNEISRLDRKKQENQFWFDIGKDLQQTKIYANDLEPLTFSRQWEDYKNSLGKILEAASEGYAVGETIEKIEGYKREFQAGRVPDPFLRFENLIEGHLNRLQSSTTLPPRDLKIPRALEFITSNKITIPNPFEKIGLKDLWISNRYSFEELIEVYKGNNLIIESPDGLIWKAPAQAFRFLFDALENNGHIRYNGKKEGLYTNTDISFIGRATFFGFPSNSRKNLAIDSWSKYNPKKEGKKEECHDRLKAFEF